LTPTIRNFTEERSTRVRYKQIESYLREKKSSCPVKRFDNCVNKNTNSTKKYFAKQSNKSEKQEYAEVIESPSNKQMLELELENDAKLTACQESLKSDVNLTDNEK